MCDCSSEPVDSGPEVDESAVPSQEDTIKLKHLVLVQIGGVVVQTFFLI